MYVYMYNTCPTVDDRDDYAYIHMHVSKHNMLMSVYIFHISLT